MSYLQEEIYAQPDVLRGLLAQQSGSIEQIATQIRAYQPRFVVIAARGTSDNAARYAKYLFEIQLSLPVSLAAPSVNTLYEAQPNTAGALVIGISQSGQSADVRQVIADAKANGALTLAITNYDDSPLAQSADHHINLCAGEEKSVAATKTYTTELTVIACLIQHIAQNDAALSRLEQVPDDVAVALSHAETLEAWIRHFSYVERLAVIGRGYNYATAFEISLKIKELCYIVGEQYSEADFRHGPIAIVSPRFPIISIAPQGKTLSLMLDLLEQLKAKEASCIVLSDSQDVLDQFEYSVALPQDVPEWLMPICAVIPGQFFAYNLALAKGYDVDQPRGLNKVTITH
ncbi:MAG: SIS domain-containing protein [Chloroflexota bacterium]